MTSGLVTSWRAKVSNWRVSLDRLLRGHPDLLDVVEYLRQPRVRRREWLDLLGGVVGIALDHVEQVVEVVGDPADELPEAFQPL